MSDQPERPSLRRLLAFCAITVVGAWLAVISLVVVLEFGAPSPPELSVDRMRQSFALAESLAVAKHAAPVPFPIDTLRLAASATPGGRALRTLYRLHASLLAQWDARRPLVLADTRRLGTMAADAYAVDATRPGMRDRVDRFRTLTNWHEAQLARYSAQLDTARGALAEAGLYLGALADARGGADEAAGAERVRGLLGEAARKLAASPTPGPIPPQVDAQWTDATFPGFHPFAVLGAWLRTQRSVELVTIMGMIGFGLLGAAASSVVRARPGDAGGVPPQPLGSDLVRMTVSGTSAALATYLAVKGSLAVVSSNGAEPNPHVLLLSCFVAAVYWENAWDRVRKAVEGDSGAPDRSPAADEEPRKRDDAGGDAAPAREKLGPLKMVGDADLVPAGDLDPNDAAG